MADPLYEKIIAGLERLTDREKFEACAANLLHKDYPRLVAVPGGSDAGFDGVAVQKDGDTIQLICTTTDQVIVPPRRRRMNLKSRRRSPLPIYRRKLPIYPTMRHGP